MKNLINITENIDWDAAGTLSIVSQGSLLKANLVETANICRHWRALFPQAQIVLSVSSSDVVIPNFEGSRMTAAQLASPYAADSILLAALACLLEVCNEIVWAEPMLPLPPIKSDAPKPNNMNLQIAAARSGLAAVTGQHVLRIRSDAYFASRAFLGQWEKGILFPRESAAVFRQRILISWLFTLNPYTIERLPFHFSDWFHFGRTEDVRRVWDIPYIDLADATFFLTHSHPPGSTAGERLFNTRVAVEQHAAYYCFKPSFPELLLDQHNDQRSADLCIDILRDNFILCNLVAADYIFPKYRGELSDPSKEVHCLTPEDWLALVSNRNRSPREVLSRKILAVTDPRKFQLSQPFPWVFRGRALMTKCGAYLNDAIVGNGEDGTLVFGPLVEIPTGRYLAQVELATLRGPGLLLIEAKVEQARVLRAVKVFADETTSNFLVFLRFDIEQSVGRNFEIVVDTFGIREVAVGEIRILERREFDAQLPRHYPAALLAPHESQHQGGCISARVPAPITASPQKVASSSKRVLVSARKFLSNLHHIFRRGFSKSIFTSVEQQSRTTGIEPHALSRSSSAEITAPSFGRLFTGPADMISPGTYIARLRVVELSGDGEVHLRVALSDARRPHQTTVVARTKFSITREARWTHFDINFTVPVVDENIVEQIFDIDCTYLGIEKFVVSGVEVLAKDSVSSNLFNTEISLDNLWLGEAGHNGKNIIAISDEGVVFHGPYLQLQPGHYRITTTVIGGATDASVQLKATCNAGRKTLGVHRFPIAAAETRSEVIDFVIHKTEADFEVVFSHLGGRGLQVIGVECDKMLLIDKTNFEHA